MRRSRRRAEWGLEGSAQARLNGSAHRGRQLAAVRRSRRRAEWGLEGSAQA
ncbi:hypothetical protein [Blastococcus mobilis]|uniref:Uncharacterized protein n=1 Tax=Blastococcus mobilis TaxID=1938746 RepID=A0A238WCD7_9ACTN|nr:hypothetical protein [Blastococcus mobilis]SNR44138.1 hypothetical protein SAMN06272737_107109 [Blastococcus mobilis]